MKRAKSIQDTTERIARLEKLEATLRTKLERAQKRLDAAQTNHFLVNEAHWHVREDLAGQRGWMNALRNGSACLGIED